MAIHSLILHATEVDLSIYIGSDLATFCCTRCYSHLHRCKRALDNVGEIEYEIKQDFYEIKHDDPFQVIRLATESRVRVKARGEKELRDMRL